MKVCLVFYDMQDFGGLEEYAATLAVGLQASGHAVTALSAAWVSPDNQYARRLRAGHVRLVHPPRWLSAPASEWPTKERILSVAMRALAPVVFAGGIALAVGRRQPWSRARDSAWNWLRGALTRRLIGPDRRRALARLWLTGSRWRWGFDLLHVQGYTSNLLFVVDWARARRIPVVYEEHQTPDPQFDWWEGFGRSINNADVVVAVSDQSARGLREVCRVTRPIVVRNPLLPDPVATGWRRPPAAQNGHPIVLTTVARLYVTKGLEYLLEAIVQVRAKHASADFRVYGDGPLSDDLMGRAARLGLDGRSIFRGAFTDREELGRILGRTDIFVMPSILEGQPLGLVEAMAYGCPIVATSVGGVPELIEDGVNGLLCAPKDPASLARTICALIEDPRRRASLGRAARESYERGPFQPQAVCGHLTSIYGAAMRGEPLTSS